MATTAEAAAIITRNADPHGDGFGIAADVSYSFYGGDFAFSVNQQTAAMTAWGLWDDVARLSFFIDNEDPEIAFKNYSDPDTTGVASVTGSFEFNADETHTLGFNLARGTGENLALGQGGFRTMIHELGHAIGLLHPGDYDAGGPDDPPIEYATHRAYVEDSNQYTVMSYFSETETGANYDGLRARTPLLHDIASAQQFYGANMTTRNGNTVYGFNSNAGPIYTLVAGDRAVFCIWDAGGTDTLDMSGYSVDQTIRLESGAFSSTGGLTFNMSMADAVDVNGNNSWEPGFDAARVANLIENAIGGSGGDVLSGNQAANILDGGAGGDYLEGLAGDDTLIGGSGADEFIGGLGFDRVVYNAIAGETIVITPFGNPAQGAWTVKGPAQAAGDTLGGIEAFTFGAGNDTITLRDDSRARSITIDGAGGNDNITGSSGESDIDTLIGGAGRDGIATLRGVFHAFGGIVAGPTSWIENLADNDVLIVDRQSFGADYRFTSVFSSTSLLGTYTGTDGSTARGFARINYSGAGFVDTVYGALGNDIILGFDGNDVLWGSNENDVIEGGNGGDSLYGEDGNDIMKGGLGFDNLRGGNGNDKIGTGGGGSETAFGEAGDDTLTGSADGETLDGGIGNDKLFGEDGNDTLYGADGDDRLNGGAGNDHLDTGLGIETVDGGVGTDSLYMDRSAMTAGVSFFLNGAAGSDGSRAVNIETMRYYAGSGNDTVHGGNGSDIIAGGRGNDKIEGGDGGDTLLGEDGNDFINGGLGFDNMYGGNGDDKIQTGGGGLETAFGEAGNDTLTGSADGESLDGGIGNDRLFGEGGIDVLYGSDGDDLLVGGAGSDEVNGGAGKDIFRFDAALNATSNIDRIVDFVAVDDTFQLDSAVFEGLATGILAASAFRQGTAAADANDRIIYDTATSALYYDADGAGGAAQIRFATLLNAAVLTSADFEVI